MNSSKFLHAFLSLTLAFQPFVSVFANNVVQAETESYLGTTQDKTSQGTQSYRDFKAEFGSDLIQFPDLNSSNDLLYQQRNDDGSFTNKQIPVSELFSNTPPDSSMSGWTSGDSESFEQQGLNARQHLSNGSDPASQAFDTFDAARSVTHPDLSNDRLWSNAESVYDLLEGNTVDCSASAEFDPLLKTCYRPNISGRSCESSHLYTAGIIDYRSGPTNYASCGNGCIRVWLGRVGDNYWSGRCKIYEHDMSFEMINPQAITSATINQKKWDDHMQILVANQLVWAGPNPSQFPPETDGRCELSTSWNVNSPTDITSILKNTEHGDIVPFKVRVSVTGAGEGYASMIIRYDPNKVLDSKGWNNDECIDRAKQFKAYYGSTGASCIQMPRLDSDGCRTVNAVTFCESAFPPHAYAFDDISPFCEKVRVTNPSPMQFDGQASCQALESSPSCAFMHNKCKYPDDVVSQGTKLARQDAIQNGMTQPTASMINAQINHLSAEGAKSFFEFGIGRNASQSDINKWSEVIKQHGYNKARQMFNSSAESAGEIIINRSSCYVTEEVWDCNPNNASQGGASACRLKNLFENDFADCTEVITKTSEPETYVTYLNESCESLLELSECSVTRNISTPAIAPASNFYRSCFIQEDVSFTPSNSNIISLQSSVSFTGNHATATVIQQPSFANQWTTIVRLNGSGQPVMKEVKKKIECPAPEEGEESSEEPCYETILVDTGEITCPSDQFISGTITGKGSMLLHSHVDDPAEPDNYPCQRSSDDWSDVNWSCQRTEVITGHNGSPISDQVRRAVLPEMYPGEFSLGSNACVQGYAGYETKEYSQGEFCWQNLDGVEQCTIIDESNGGQVGTNTCSSLEARESTGECKFLGIFPAESSTGSTGFSYVREHRYECIDEEITISENITTSEYVCNGIVSCLGEECVDVNHDKSNDFAKAASLLSAVESIGRDVQCDIATDGGMSTCKVFNGKAQTCKKALGGWVDCCKGVSGVSLSQYIAVIQLTAKADRLAQTVESTNAFLGAYNAIRNPVVGSASSTMNYFSSALSNATGGFIGGTDSTVSALSPSAIKSTMMEGAHSFISGFGQQGSLLADKLFTKGADGVFTLAPGLQMISLAFTIYQVADLIVNLIWECTQDELQLAVDKQLKKTKYLGTYCRRKVFGACIERRETYCIFNSPLSRIIMEQAKPQLGLTFGKADKPDCSGLTFDQIESLDWDRIDLGEWFNLLKISDTSFYTKDIGLSSVTGSTSSLDDVFGGNNDRRNTLERNVDRLQGTDIDNVNREAVFDLPIKH